jgi:Flp pilus assembly protein TadB
VASSRRVSRIRAAALVILLGGAVLAFLVGTMVPAHVNPAVGATGKLTIFTSTSDTGETAFNWLLALLVIGPAVVASTVLYGAAEIAVAVRRSGRSRSHDRFDAEVGDEL